jgi:hypothetical protein
MHVTQAGLQLPGLLPVPPKCWDYRHEPLHPGLYYYLLNYEQWTKHWLNKAHKKVAFTPIPGNIESAQICRHTQENSVCWRIFSQKQGCHYLRGHLASSTQICEAACRCLPFCLGSFQSNPCMEYLVAPRGFVLLCGEVLLPLECLLFFSHISTNVTFHTLVSLCFGRCNCLLAIFHLILQAELLILN